MNERAKLVVLAVLIVVLIAAALVTFLKPARKTVRVSQPGAMQSERIAAPEDFASSGPRT